MTQTTYWYMHTDQWRYDRFGADTLAATTGAGRFANTTTADAVALSQRLGWQPFYPQFDISSLDVADRAAAAGEETIPYLVEQLKNGGINFAAEDPDAHQNHPKIWSIWRANTLGSSAKGDQYFFRHLLGVDSSATAEETPEHLRPPRCEMARRGTGREGRSDAHAGLPHDQPHAALGRRAPGGHLVREA